MLQALAGWTISTNLLLSLSFSRNTWVLFWTHLPQEKVFLPEKQVFSRSTCSRIEIQETSHTEILCEFQGPLVASIETGTIFPNSIHKLSNYIFCRPGRSRLLLLILLEFLSVQAKNSLSWSVITLVLAVRKVLPCWKLSQQKQVCYAGEECFKP